MEERKKKKSWNPFHRKKKVETIPVEFLVDRYERMVEERGRDKEYVQRQVDEKVRPFKNEYIRLLHEEKKRQEEIKRLKQTEENLLREFGRTLLIVKKEVMRKPKIESFEHLISSLESMINTIKDTERETPFTSYETTGSLKFGKAMLDKIVNEYLKYRKEYDKRKNNATVLTNRLLDIENRCGHNPEYGIHLSLSKGLLNLIGNSYDLGYNTAIQDSVNNLLEAMNENINYKEKYRTTLLEKGKKTLIEIKDQIDKSRAEFDTLIVDYWFGVAQTLYGQAKEEKNSQMVEGLINAISVIQDTIGSMLKQSDLRMAQERYIENFSKTVGRQVCPKCKGKGML